MGGFATGLIGSLGAQVQAKNERDINARHQGNMTVAQQYYKMGDEATKNNQPDLAAEYYKAGFQLHTTPPDKKAPADLLNPGNVLQRVLQSRADAQSKARAQQAANQPPAPLAPNGANPTAAAPGVAPGAIAPSLAPPPNPLPGGPTNANAMRPLTSFMGTGPGGQ